MVANKAIFSTFFADPIIQVPKLIRELAIKLAAKTLKPPPKGIWTSFNTGAPIKKIIIIINKATLRANSGPVRGGASYAGTCAGLAGIVRAISIEPCSTIENTLFRF